MRTTFAPFPPARCHFPLALLLAALCLLLAGPVAAKGLHIDITKGGLQPMPIALPYFAEKEGATPKPATDYGKRLSDVVSADLERSGLFRPLDRSAFLQDSVSLWRDGPQYRDWRLPGAEALVSGAVTVLGDQVSVDFYLYDVFQGAPVGSGKRFTTSARDWRHLAHRVADEIYSRLTGEGGYFTSRISFISEQGTKKWLTVMDQDGASRLDLTHGEHLVLTPRFSPDATSLFYLSYESREPRIYRWEIYTGAKSMQSNYPGLNSSPSWSPDGTRMAMTLSKDGNPEIYIKNLRTGELTRVTHNAGIDTSPSWSPDGRRLVFTSDRGGSPQLYVMSAEGGEPKRISFEGKYNSAPAWSPRGDLIAFVQAGEGKFRIAVTDPEGRRVRVMTDSWMDESPVWSPNGRVILFSRQQQGGQSKLYTIDLTGHNERAVDVGAGVGASDPSWSPLLR